uniref:Uncharacterized protein n=1 Tax=Meloidogyne enterolobii TaxID=390850 RepID=A0A6V7U6Q0_MELEN|nr:unnamed protein product [Meloidogyne enterolobii]
MLINLFLLFCLVLKLCSTQNGDDDNLVGNLIDSRSSVARKFYKCYQGIDGSATTECVGRVCIRVTHNQSGADKLYCKNFTEPSDPAVGECIKMSEGQMPGQSEEMCACAGDYCNGSRRSLASHLIISFCFLILCLSSTILCSFLYRRNSKKYLNTEKEVVE